MAEIATKTDLSRLTVLCRWAGLGKVEFLRNFGSLRLRLIIVLTFVVFFLSFYGSVGQPVFHGTQGCKSCPNIWIGLVDATWLRYVRAKTS